MEPDAMIGGTSRGEPIFFNAGANKRELA